MSAPLEAFETPASLDGERVDRSVAFLTGWSRSAVASVIDAGGVLVGGRPASRSRRLVAGEVVEVTKEPELTGRPQPEEIELDVRFADNDLAIIAKPAGMVVHPGAGQEHGTLVSALLARFPDIAEVGDPLRPGIVHRLDRGTSGLLVTALSQRAYEALVDAFARREIKRRYIALCWGNVEAHQGVIDAPLGRSPIHRTKMTVRRDGKEARTHYKVRERYPDPPTSLLDCELETGRTHQIRVHLTAIGHPVVGDVMYGGDRVLPGLDLHDRPFLHAWSLTLMHPITSTTLSFEDPLPSELEVVRAALAERT